MKESRIEQCVICGDTGPVTDDHIPPSNLFPHPQPSDLQTVPACRSCNLGASKDDEYFRNALVLREDLYDHPAVQCLIPGVMRSFVRPQARKFARRFLGSIRETNIVTPSGIYLGRKPVCTVTWQRVERVLVKIIRGYHFIEFGQPLPAGYRVNVYETSTLNDLEPAAAACLKTMCTTVVTHGKGRSFGGDVFEYRFMPVEGDPCRSWWVIRFYGKMTFVGHVT